MKKWILSMLAALLLFSGCVTAPEAAVTEPAAETEVDSVSSATPEGTGWNIALYGVRDDELWQSDMDYWSAEEGHFVEMDIEKKGETHRYGGVLLKEVAAIVDDPAGGMPYVFQEELWNEGYEIILTAADGYSAAFSTADVSADEVILAVTRDGEEIPPMVIGNLTSKAWVKDLAEIEIGLAPVDLAANSFELELEINGRTAAYTIGELETMPLYMEGPGMYTNSYGNSFTCTWGGVRLIPLLQEYMEVTPETSIKVIAMDGYEMTYGGEMLLDQHDGEWLLAFREDGIYMPEDPGYIRLVKAGPECPEITGHVSARMIKKIVSVGEPFRDFSLTLVQKDLTEVFDRQTMQSGVVTNKNRVVYHDRKSDTDIPYLGISLWRLLERPTGYKAVRIEAADGFSITLDNSEVEGNDDVIIAMFTGGQDELLDDREWPLRLVWDKDAELVPEGIKSIRNVTGVTLIY